MVLKNKERPTVQCIKCGHVWRPYISDPECCPKCRSKYWNRGESKINLRDTIIIGQENISEEILEPAEEIIQEKKSDKKIKLHKPEF